MTLLSSSLRRPWLTALSCAFLLAACGQEPVEPAEPELLVSNRVVIGQAWDGPEVRLYSQGNEELIVRNFFGDRKGGFFVDVGSAGPIEGSTTYYLEKHLGWKGIAIDALSEYAPAFEKERPNTRFFSFIVTDHSGKSEKFYRVANATQLSSTSEGRVWDGLKLRTDTIEVPTTTLDELLEREGVSRIDFLSIDIEGGEQKALTGFDIDRYRPELICIEWRGGEEFFAKYFSQHGYERIDEFLDYDYVNWYYKRSKPDGGHDGA